MTSVFGKIRAVELEKLAHWSLRNCIGTEGLSSVAVQCQPVEDRKG